MTSTLLPRDAGRHVQGLAGAGAAALLASVLFAGLAMAGTDTTFDTAFTQLDGWLSGSGGRVITILALAYAAAGAIARMSIATILVPAGVGLLVGIGGPIVLASVTAEIPDTAPAFVLDAEPAPLVQHLHVKEVI